MAEIDTVDDKEWSRFIKGLTSADETLLERLARAREITKQMINRDKN